MPDKAWKAFERRVAGLLGGRRLGPTGDDGPDVVTSWLSVQCKLRTSVPAWILDAVDNARRGADTDRLGVAIIKRKNTLDRDSLVVLTLGDWIDWIEDKDEDNANR